MTDYLNVDKLIKANWFNIYFFIIVDLENITGRNRPRQWLIDYPMEVEKEEGVYTLI